MISEHWHALTFRQGSPLQIPSQAARRRADPASWLLSNLSSITGLDVNQIRDHVHHPVYGYCVYTRVTTYLLSAFDSPFERKTCFCNFREFFFVSFRVSLGNFYYYILYISSFLGISLSRIAISSRRNLGSSENLEVSGVL